MVVVKKKKSRCVGGRVVERSETPLPAARIPSMDEQVYVYMCFHMNMVVVVLHMTSCPLAARRQPC